MLSCCLAAIISSYQLCTCLTRNCLLKVTETILSLNIPTSLPFHHLLELLNIFSLSLFLCPYNTLVLLLIARY